MDSRSRKMRYWPLESNWRKLSFHFSLYLLFVSSSQPPHHKDGGPVRRAPRHELVESAGYIAQENHIYMYLQLGGARSRREAKPVTQLYRCCPCELSQGGTLDVVRNRKCYSTSRIHTNRTHILKCFRITYTMVSYFVHQRDRPRKHAQPPHPFHYGQCAPLAIGAILREGCHNEASGRGVLNFNM